MSQLTEHFTDSELGVVGVDRRLVTNAAFLCKEILEPIHDKFGIVSVHDGYRDPGHNSRVGGKTASFHLFTDCHAAADISVTGAPIRRLFDWLRLESELPFDKVIMETNVDQVSLSRRTQNTLARARGKQLPIIQLIH